GFRHDRLRRARTRPDGDARGRRGVTRYRPTVVEIDLEAIAHNVRLLRPPGVELMVVVKADGYGHGAAEVAKAALEAGASSLGVSLVEEGLGLGGPGSERP